MHSLDISVKFTQAQYTGSEDEGFVLVTLELVGGKSSRLFNVTVTPLEQSPVSASNVYHCCIFIVNCIVGTSDFSPAAINITFGVGESTKSSSIEVHEDNKQEYNETFNIFLSLSPFLNLRIEVDDKHSAEGQIVDSTGKTNYSMFKLL